MAELVYGKDGRLLFTKEMKQEYTLLMPQMLPVHFGMFRQLLVLEGYKVDMLTTNHRGIVDEGLKYVHNDTCYPALLVIGQLIDAVKHGGYDPHKVALLITQTGGGCRASNYIHLLRKALEKAGMSYIPVISVNLSGMEKNPGWSLTLPLIRKMIYAMMYGDLIVNVANQVRPYEVMKGDTDKMVETYGSCDLVMSNAGVQIVHPFGGNHVEGGHPCRDVGLDHLVIEPALAQILAETAPCGIFFALDLRAVRIGHARGRRHEQIEHALLGGFLRARAHLFLLLLAHELHARFHQVAHNGLDIAPDIAHFSELGGLGLDKGRIGEPCQASGNLSFAHARGPDHENVLGRNFRVQRLGHARASPAVSQGNGNGTLGLVLAHDVFIKLAHDFSRRHDRTVCVRH